MHGNLVSLSSSTVFWVLALPMWNSPNQTRLMNPTLWISDYRIWSMMGVYRGYVWKPGPLENGREKVGVWFDNLLDWPGWWSPAPTWLPNKPLCTGLSVYGGSKPWEEWFLHCAFQISYELSCWWIVIWNRKDGDPGKHNLPALPSVKQQFSRNISTFRFHWPFTVIPRNVAQWGWEGYGDGSFIHSFIHSFQGIL